MSYIVVTSAYKRLQVVTSGYKQFQTVSSGFKQWLSATHCFLTLAVCRLKLKHAEGKYSSFIFSLPRFFKLKFRQTYLYCFLMIFDFFKNLKQTIHSLCWIITFKEVKSWWMKKRYTLCKEYLLSRYRYT